nr:helix-turn-helix domain-containing protein [Allomuricauda sp.]
MRKNHFNLIGIEQESLVSIIGQVVAKELHEVLPKYEFKSQNKGDEVLSTKEACELLRISKTTLWRLNKKGAIPVRRLNTKTVFLKSELLNYLKKNDYEN